MKSVGIVRKVDELGRVVLPIELRRQFKVDINDPVEFAVDGEMIRLTKYIPKCAFCKSQDEVVEKNGKTICGKCLEYLKGL